MKSGLGSALPRADGNLNGELSFAAITAMWGWTSELTVHCAPRHCVTHAPDESLAGLHETRCLLML
jgi:hypothetical protein